MKTYLKAIAVGAALVLGAMGAVSAKTCEKCTVKVDARTAPNGCTINAITTTDTASGRETTTFVTTCPGDATE